MSAKACNETLTEKVTAACVNFASQAVASFIGVLFAGLMLLIIGRVYVAWEMRQAANQMGRWQAEDEELQRKEAAAAAKLKKK